VQWFDIEDEQRLQRGEKRAREVRVVKREMISYPLPEWQGHFIDRCSGRITMS
jgi:hypothetical protein